MASQIDRGRSELTSAEMSSIVRPCLGMKVQLITVSTALGERGGVATT